MTSTHSNDMIRNKDNLKGLCLYEVQFKEAIYNWKLLLVINPQLPKDAFWFLPHDNENTAFDAALYATQKYGGGFLSVVSQDKRLHQNQDPNRNFSSSQTKEISCKAQKYASNLYTKIIFTIIETYKKESYPFLALHSNENSWRGAGGKGSVSILHSSKYVHSYPAYKNVSSSSTGLKDEDSLIYIAGLSKTPDLKILKSLLSKGIHVKYEIVNQMNNDCSMSNYVVLHKSHSSYYNIEVEHGALKTQKIMIDKLMTHIQEISSY
ncbi:MAG: Unknown protein [uncultured Sulfurovum sp.]|uniref:Uncharacterized protein n=1 Tax=uncultured Sulfurovum sp. TaxID=269237 RepID=A0A6S6TQ20_9BACT|nr:MAG: Unknown protein [uncultured Sulfurovum sp.]